MRDENGKTGGASGTDDLGATEREMVAQRAKKADALRALGVNPFGNGFAPRHLAADLVARYGDAPVEEIAKDPGSWSLAGRVLAVRSFGKAAFLRLRDRSGDIQVWVKKDRVGEQGFELFKLLDIGDIVGRGRPGHAHEDRRAHPRGDTLRDPHQGAAPAAGEVARPHGRRDALPPAVRRPDREPGVARGLPRRARGSSGHPPLPRRRAASSRSRRRRCTSRRRRAAPRRGPSRRTTTRSTST